MTSVKSLTIVAALLVGGASPAMAQNGLPTGGQCPVAGGAGGGYGCYGYGYGYAAAPLYNYATPVADLAAPGYGYAAPAYGYAATAPLYNYAAPAYGGYAAPAVAPGQGATTIIIVTPAPAYTAPNPWVARPLYSYAPGYGGYGWGGYGRWRAGYWWR